MVRILLALLFALISIGILMLSLKIMKLRYNHKNNLWASGIFAFFLYIFSFFPSVVLTILTALVVLIVLKYLYLRTWRDTFKLWGIWVLSWVIIFVIIALSFTRPSLI